MKGTEKSETDLHWVYRYLKDGNYPPGLTATEKRIVRKRAERFCFLDEELIFLGTIQAKEHGAPSRKVLLTRPHRLEVVGVAHIDKEGNHNGLERTVDSVSAEYYWVGIYKFVKDYIRACTTCRAIRPRLGTGRDVGPTSSTEVERLDCGSEIGVDCPSQTTSPNMEVTSVQEVEGLQEEENEPKSKCFWDLVDLRLFGPYRVGTLLKYILVVLDVHSLWPEAFVLDSISQTTVVHVLLKLISRYGRMNAVVVSGDDEILETAVNDALQILQQAISFKIMLHRNLLKVTGIVTRSRTGHSKPKDLGKEHVYPAKRKSSAVTDTPVTKQTKFEQEEKVTTVEEAEAVSDTESDISTLENSKMKITVGLDDYYSAVLQYIKGSGYPPNSSPSFKRLIRDISKHYVVKDQTLYHIHLAGKSSTQLKRVIMTYPERHRLLRVAHESDGGDEFHYPASAMLTKLRNAHWKGKGVDCEAFVLACIYCDSAECKFKDVPPPLERKLLTRDTFETYKEIKHYLNHEQFSNESVTIKLEDLLKLIKKFRLEDGSLFHVISNRRLSLLTNASDRLEAIKLSHLLKGTHADEKGTLKQLSENYYWFGVATDVRVYTNLCCGNGDWRHLIDRYFKFREFNMNIPLTDVPVNLPYTPMRRTRVKLEQLDNTAIAKEMEEMIPYSQMEEPTIDCVEVNVEATPASPVNPTVSEDDSNMKPLGIFVASVANTEEKTCDKATGEDSTDPEVDLKEIEVITDVSDVVTEPPKVAEEPEIVRTITPKIVAVRVSEERNLVSSKPLVTVPGSRTQDAATQRLLSDPITIAAVKSILPEDCIMCAEIDLQVDPAVAKKTNEVKPDKPVDGAHDTSDKPDLSSSGPIVPSVEVVVPSLPCVLPVAFNSGETDQKNLVVSLNEDTDSDESQQLDTDEEVDSLYGEIEVTQDGVPKLVTNTPLQGAQVLKLKDSLLHKKGEGNSRGAIPRPHYRCTVCNKVFHGEIKFKVHMYKHTGLKPFHCEQCDKKYTNNKSLALHMKVHTGDLHFLCSVCGKATVSKTALKSHLKSHLSPGGGFPVKCDICNREFRRRHLMERHKQFKHLLAQSEFPCNACSKVFGHQRSLKRHYMSHHMGVRNHNCLICGKGFYRKEYLTSHMLQHVGHETSGKPRSMTYKRQPVTYAEYSVKQEADDMDGVDAEEVELEDPDKDKQVQRIILHEDEDGGMRVVDLNTAREVKRLLDNSVIRPEVGETMVVQIEQPSGGECRIVRVDNGGMVQVDNARNIQTEEQVVEVPMEGETYMEYQEMEGQGTEYVTVMPTSSTPSIVAVDHYAYGYTTTNVDSTVQKIQELVYSTPAVQYEVECVGDVDDEEALSAINLLAQASAAQYETVTSQI